MDNKASRYGIAKFYACAMSTTKCKSRDKPVIPDIVLNEFKLSKFARISAFSNPWGEPHVFLAVDEHDKIVLRRWNGEERLSRMRNENRILFSLREQQFKDFSKPLLTQQNKKYVLDQNRAGWTAYEYIRGNKISLFDKDSGIKIANLLVKLHRATNNIKHNMVYHNSPFFLKSAIEQMLGEGGSLSGLKYRGIAKKIPGFVFKRLAGLSELPKAIIHGDAILDNVIFYEGEGRLIDFEFTRYDVRIFDLAASFAPSRDETGAFNIASRDYLNGVIGAYFEEERIAVHELECLPIVTAIRFCLIQDGLFQLKSHHRGSALHVLDKVLLG